MKALLVVLILVAFTVGCWNVFDSVRPRKPRRLDLHKDIFPKPTKDTSMYTLSEKIETVLEVGETKDQFYSRIFDLIWAHGWHELNRGELIPVIRDEIQTLICRYHGEGMVTKTEVEKEIDEILELCMKNKTIETMVYAGVTYYCIPEDKISN